MSLTFQMTGNGWNLTTGFEDTVRSTAFMLFYIFFSMAQHLSLELHCYSNEIVWPFHVDCVRTPISELDLSPSGIQQAIPILNVQT